MGYNAMFKNAKISALEMLREDVAAGSKETVADNSEVNPSSGTGETTAASNDVQITQSQPTATGDGTYTVNGKTINVKSTGTGPVPDLASILKSNPRDNLSRTILNNATKNMESAKTSESTQTGESTQNNQASGQPPYNQEFFKDPWEYMQKRKAAEEQSADTKTLTSDDIISIGAGPLNPELVNNPEAFAEKYGVKKPEEKEKTNDVPPQYEKLNLVVDGLDEPKEETPVNTNSLEYKINEKRIEKETIISSNNEYIATGLTKVNRLAYDVYSSTFKSESFGSTTSVPTVENEIVSNAINGSIELAQKLSKLLNTIGEIGNRFDRIDADLVAEADNLGSIFRMDLSPKEKIAPITGGVGATKDADKLMKELPVIEEVKEEDEDKKLKLTSSEELEDGKDKDKDKDPDKDKDKGSDDPDAGAEDKKKKKPKGPGTSNPDKDKNKDKDKDKDKDPDKDKDKDKDKDPDKDKDKDKDSDKDKDKDKDDDKEKDPKEENKEDDNKDKVVTDDDENKDNQGNQDNQDSNKPKNVSSPKKGATSYSYYKGKDAQENGNTIVVEDIPAVVEEAEVTPEVELETEPVETGVDEIPEIVIPPVEPETQTEQSKDVDSPVLRNILVAGGIGTAVGAGAYVAHSVVSNKVDDKDYKYEYEDNKPSETDYAVKYSNDDKEKKVPTTFEEHFGEEDM